MISFDLVLMAGALLVFGGWLVTSRRARTICRASVRHVDRGCEVCPRTFTVTPVGRQGD